MNKDAVMLALKQIPRIHKGLKKEDIQAKEDMNIIIETLKSASYINSNMAMGKASTSSLISAVQGREVSKGLLNTIKLSALHDLSTSFNCEADFRDEKKLKLLEELI